jgi:hypothetical protein
MAKTFSPLQMTESISWSGFTDKNHLATIFGRSPQKASKLITRIHNTNFGMNIDTYMGGDNTLTLDTDDDYTWQLIGTAKKNVPLVEARINGVTLTTVDQAGKNQAEFELVFGEDYFFDEQIIVGHKNEVYPIQIQADPIKEGTNFVYRCKLVTGDMDLFVPFAELQGGKRFSKEWTLVEQTLSKKGSGVNYTAPFSMRNAFSFLRKEQTFPGNMKGRPIGTMFKDDKGNMFSIWTQYASYQMDQDMMQEKAFALVFATANRAPDGTYKNEGKSGYMKVQGAGLRQQIECSNTEFYNTFTIDLINNLLMDVSEGRLKSDQRKFILKTGERGAVQFHKALENYVHMYSPNRDEDRLYKKDVKGVTMGKGYGGQFVEYTGPNNIVVCIEVDSMYDDRVRNKLYHPEGGVAESYRYDIFDIGSVEGEPNIRKVTVKDSEYIMGIEPGLRNPLSPDAGRTVMTTGVDGWKEHRACYISGMVKDPSKTASLISNLQE